MQKITDLLNYVWQKYRIEVIFISFAFIILIISTLIYLTSLQETDNQQITIEENNHTRSPQKFVIDLSGAIQKPDVYEVTPGARLKDVLALAQGLSIDADREFFARNFNLSRYVKDQEKIHVPTKYEIMSGAYKEPNRLIDFTQPQTINFQIAETTSQSNLSKVNINKASLNELDELPGIGQTTAEKIIKQRPFISLEELETKKIMNKNVFDKIKELVSVN